MKMIGTFWVFSRALIISAVSNPSMSGMCASSRISANSSFKSSFRASLPEPALTRFWPSPPRIASSATRFSGWSSTIKMPAFSSESIMLGDPPIHSLTASQFFVVALTRSQLERFLAPEAKNSEHAEAPIEQLVDPVLQSLVDIDQHVAAQNHIELVERAVADKIMLRKQDVLPERSSQDCAFI